MPVEGGEQPGGSGREAFSGYGRNRGEAARLFILQAEKQKLKPLKKCRD